MYQALYRKWRPRVFDDVVGQEHITTTLKNEVAGGRFSHAYLFTGSRGTGKTTCSKIIAKAVNCEHPVDGNPCNVCAACSGIDDGSILDVSEIDAASNNGVDNIRQLREEAYFMPAAVKYRVYILDECHMLSAGAVNALLKILEEPPAHVIFILATTEVHKVLPTILSRCQRFDFRRIRARVIANRLLYIAQQEGVTLADDAAMAIARLSDGGMRDALSLLDRCLSCGDEITAQTVTQTAGLTGNPQLFALAEAIISKQPAQALAVVDALAENSVDFSRLCEQFIHHMRNLMIAKTAKDPQELLQLLPEEFTELQAQAKTISLRRVMSALDILQDTMGKLSRTSFKRTEMEMAVLRLCEDTDSELENLLVRIEKLEKAVRAGVPVAPVSPSAPAPNTAPSPASEPRPTPPTAAKRTDALEVTAFDRWDKVLEALRPLNGALYGALVGSRAYTSGDMMLIDCENEMFRSLLRTSAAAKESLRDAILAVTAQKYSLGPYNPAKHAVAAAAEKSDPLQGLLKKASELNIPVEKK